jgi:hypothetical protein
MNAAFPPPRIDADWQVPAFEEAVYATKRHAHALVIPVINEGERIRGQLARIKAAGLPVDVIIADGGSTDGSLDPDFVRAAGVRAVLTKTGPGKLSAQLRLAYAWALRQGYEGIVTIDGNGKDGVEAVADMVARLEEGCDYVQGSRYLPGGVAENTPLERTIANRFVHAPLLSLAGRHWFGDTTNGFRAYSARYLTHAGVQPFRDEFRVYGLLFYLTVRAGQLGLKVGHVPVARRYPDDGKVPTKITGLAPKLALLGETVHAATGGHTPDDAAGALPSRLWALLVALAVALPLLLAIVAAPPFSPDSWAFWELAQTVFGDFYRFTHWRSYASDAPYSAAFPPVWPGLIAVADAVTGSGPRTGLYLAFAAFGAFAMLSEEIGRRVTGAAWIGLAAALVLVLGPKMLLDELGAGRTMPLQLALFAGLALGIAAPRPWSIARAGTIGLICGLAVMNRFDAVLLPPLVAGLALWLNRSPLPALAVLAGAALAIAPWMAYSLPTFGTVFATDNAGIATALDPRAFVTDWWPAPQATLADDPGAWATRVAGNVGAFAGVAASLIATPMVAIFVLALAIPAGLHLVAARRPVGSEARHSTQGLAPLGALVVLLGLLLIPQIVTGYVEYRYFTPVFWIGFLFAGCWLASRGTTAAQTRLYATLAALPLIAAAFVFALMQWAGSKADAGERAHFDAPPDVAALQRCLVADPDGRVLILGDDALAAKAGALGGVPAMMEPRNMAEGRLGDAGARAFARHWQVTHVFIADPARLTWARRVFALPAPDTCDPRLHRLPAR